jgi:hypothetical protein
MFPDTIEATIVSICRHGLYRMHVFVCTFLIDTLPTVYHEILIIRPES